MQTFQTIRVMGVLCACVLAFACGGPPGQDSASAAEDTGEVTEAFGELTCRTTAADASVSGPNSQAFSTNTYDHSSCRNSFIVNAHITTGMSVGYNGFIPPKSPYGCNSTWFKALVYRKVTSPGPTLPGTGPTTVTSYEQTASTGTVYGIEKPDGSGECAAPFASWFVGDSALPVAGDYKVVLTGGFLTYYQPVGVVANIVFP